MLHFYLCGKCVVSKESCWFYQAWGVKIVIISWSWFLASHFHPSTYKHVDCSQATLETHNYSDKTEALVIARLHNCNNFCIFTFIICELILIIFNKAYLFLVWSSTLLDMQYNSLGLLAIFWLIWITSLFLLYPHSYK